MQRHQTHRRKWMTSHQAWLVAGTTVGAVIVGRPMIARSIEKAGQVVQEGAIARSPLLDQVLYRADEALDLRLTEEQKADLKPILASTARQAIAIQQDTTLTPATKQARFKALFETTRRELVPLVTEQQQDKIEAAQKNLTSLKLNLTPEQRARLQPILQTAFRQAQTVHGNTSLSPARRRAEIRDIAATARMQALQVLDHRQLQRLTGLFNTQFVTNVLTRELNLTTTQQAEVKEIVATTTEQMEAVTGDASLSTGQIQHRCYHVLGRAQGELDGILSTSQQHKLNRLATQVNAHLKLVS